MSNNKKSASAEFDAVKSSSSTAKLKDRIVKLANKGIPLLLAGPPGIGKSAIISEVLREHFDFYREERPAQWDPIDARGVPIVRRQLVDLNERLTILTSKFQFFNSVGDTKNADGVQAELIKLYAQADELMLNEKTTMIEWPNLDFLPPVGYTGRVGLFFDELNTAPVAVQNVLLQPFQATPGMARRIGPHTIHGGHVWLAAAGNRPKDFAHVNPMGAPLRNRFHIIEIDVDNSLIDSWSAWAVQNKVHSDVIAYINFQKSAFYKAPADAHGFDAFPTPRSWTEQVSPLYEDGARSVTDFQGAVGVAAATAFVSFAEEIKNMPDINKLLREVETTGKVQSINLKDVESSILYAVTFQLVSKLSHFDAADPKGLTKNVTHGVTLIKNMRDEYKGLFIALMTQGKMGIALLGTPAFAQLCREFGVLTK